MIMTRATVLVIADVLSFAVYGLRIIAYFMR